MDFNFLVRKIRHALPVKARLTSMVGALLCLYAVALHLTIVLHYAGLEMLSTSKGTSGGHLTATKPMSRLRRTLDASERRYQTMIKERNALIAERGGPREKSFPGKNEKFNSGLWDLFTPAFSCPFPVYRVGALGDGGKWVCGVERALSKPDCVVYSMGIKDLSTFEEEILRDYPNCEVYGFDFSVSNFGPQINETRASRAHFYEYEIGSVDDHGATPKKYTPQSIMKEHGHTFVDILKVDIEGSEWTAIISLIESFEGRPLPFGQLQIELHVNLWNSGWMSQVGQFREWWEKLENAGLRPFWTEPNLPHVQWHRDAPRVAEWSFINIRGNHPLVDDSIPE